MFRRTPRRHHWTHNITRTRPTTLANILKRTRRNDVSQITPADLVAPRNLEADKAELTRMLQSLHDSIDRVSGGHLLDNTIRAWHDNQTHQLRQNYNTHEATAEWLIGVAEADHHHTHQRLTYTTEEHNRHVIAAHRARLELIGHQDNPPQPTPLNTQTHRTCATPTNWTAPWDNTTNTPRNPTNNPTTEPSATRPPSNPPTNPTPIAPQPHSTP